MDLCRGLGTLLTQRTIKAKYLEIYFSESHISTKCEYNKPDAIIKRATHRS